MAAMFSLTLQFHAPEPAFRPRGRVAVIAIRHETCNQRSIIYTYSFLAKCKAFILKLKLFLLLHVVLCAVLGVNVEHNIIQTAHRLQECGFLKMICVTYASRFLNPFTTVTKTKNSENLIVKYFWWYFIIS